MRRAAAALVLGAAWTLAIRAAASAQEAPAPAEGELRVFVTDPSGKALSGEQAEVTVHLDLGGAKKIVKTEPVGPPAESTGAAARTHGGQTIRSNDHAIELLVESEPATRPARAPHFRAAIPLVTHQCSMKDAPPAEKPGKCAGCGMTMQPAPATFTAVVVVKLAGRTINAKGFQHPFLPPPASLEEAASRIEACIREMEALLASGKLHETHDAAARISKIASTLPELSGSLPAAERERVLTLGRDLTGLFEFAEATAHLGTGEDVQQVIDRYRAVLVDLRKLVK